MIREWLLIVWLGTSTNFSIQGVYWSLEDCARSRHDLSTNLGAEYVVICTQDMREGRSRYSARPGSSGIVK
jgi:hypothetical protein